MNTKTNTATPSPVDGFAAPYAARPDELRTMTFTVTEKGLLTLKAYREKVASDTGRRITLSQSLDSLLTNHPFVARGGLR